MVDIGLLHHFEELAGVGREAFDIAPLAFGVDRIEGERGFARTRKAGEHDKGVTRDFEVHVFEIVLARAPDVNRLHQGGGRGCGRGLLRGFGHERFRFQVPRVGRVGGAATHWPSRVTRRFAIVLPGGGLRGASLRLHTANPP